MSKTASVEVLSDLDMATSAQGAALNVVRRLTRQKEDLASQWATAIRLAQANGASLRDIAAVANASPQTIAKICKE